MITQTTIRRIRWKYPFLSNIKSNVLFRNQLNRFSIASNETGKNTGKRVTFKEFDKMFRKEPIVEKTNQNVNRDQLEALIIEYCSSRDTRQLSEAFYDAKDSRILISASSCAKIGSVAADYRMDDLLHDVILYGLEHQLHFPTFSRLVQNLFVSYQNAATYSNPEMQKLFLLSKQIMEKKRYDLFLNLTVLEKSFLPCSKETKESLKENLDLLYGKISEDTTWEHSTIVTFFTSLGLRLGQDRLLVDFAKKCLTSISFEKSFDSATNDRFAFFSSLYHADHFITPIYKPQETRKPIFTAYLLSTLCTDLNLKDYSTGKYGYLQACQSLNMYYHLSHALKNLYLSESIKEFIPNDIIQSSWNEFEKQVNYVRNNLANGVAVDEPKLSAGYERRNLRILAEDFGYYHNVRINARKDKKMLSDSFTLRRKPEYINKPKKHPSAIMSKDKQGRNYQYSFLYQYSNYLRRILTKKFILNYKNILPTAKSIYQDDINQRENQKFDLIPLYWNEYMKNLLIHDISEPSLLSYMACFIINNKPPFVTLPFLLLLVKVFQERNLPIPEYLFVKAIRLSNGDMFGLVEMFHIYSYQQLALKTSLEQFYQKHSASNENSIASSSSSSSASSSPSETFFHLQKEQLDESFLMRMIRNPTYIHASPTVAEYDWTKAFFQVANSASKEYIHYPEARRQMCKELLTLSFFNDIQLNDRSCKSVMIALDHNKLPYLIKDKTFKSILLKEFHDEDATLSATEIRKMAKILLHLTNLNGDFFFHHHRFPKKYILRLSPSLMQETILKFRNCWNPGAWAENNRFLNDCRFPTGRLAILDAISGYVQTAFVNEGSYDRAQFRSLTAMSVMVATLVASNDEEYRKAFNLLGLTYLLLEKEGISHLKYDQFKKFLEENPSQVFEHSEKLTRKRKLEKQQILDDLDEEDSDNELL